MPVIDLVSFSLTKKSITNVGESKDSILRFCEKINIISESEVEDKLDIVLALVRSIHEQAKNLPDISVYETHQDNRISGQISDQKA